MGGCHFLNIVLVLPSKVHCRTLLTYLSRSLVHTYLFIMVIVAMEFMYTSTGQQIQLGVR